MEKISIVMDTSVLFAGLYSARGASHQILRLIDDGQIIPVISTSLLFEYEDVLKRKQEDLNLSGDEIEIILDNICALSKFQKIYFLWRPYLRDVKDDHVLELAIASGTNIIVTHNIKDFRGIDIFNIQALSPGQFLEVIK